jgi:hypothetical protein
LLTSWRNEHADTPHLLALLRARRERPRCGTAEHRDELVSHRKAKTVRDNIRDNMW